MIYKDFYPFYASYANPMLYRGEKEQEEEFSLMKSYYPETARRIQEKVEEDVSPQAGMEAMSDGLLEDLVQVLLFHEISRRRCRRRRCRGWY